MTLPALLVLISVNLETQIGKIDDIAEITAYFPSDIPDNRVSEISERLPDPLLTRKSFMSAASALAQLSEVMNLKPILNALEYNPLPAALLVRPDEPDVATAREIEQILTNLPEVELVQLDSLWLQRLEAWLDLLDTLSSALSLIVVGGLLLIVSSTVGSAYRAVAEIHHQANRGTDSYVRRPFVYFGAFQGSRRYSGCLLTAALGHQLGIAVKALALHYQTIFAVAGLSVGQNLAMILLGASIGGFCVFFSVSRKIATFNPLFQQRYDDFQ